MAKPIFIAYLYYDTKPAKQTYILETLRKQLEPDYHVMSINNLLDNTIKFECFNDCKGLKDIDIEALIKSYSNGNTNT